MELCWFHISCNICNHVHIVWYFFLFVKIIKVYGAVKTHRVGLAIKLQLHFVAYSSFGAFHFDII